MRKQLCIFLGMTLVAVLQANAATGLKLQFLTRDLAPGARVWVEVRPEYHQIATPGTPSQGVRDSGVLQEAKGESVWQFDVPATGKVSPITHDFEFPVDLDRTKSDQVGVIMLKTRFRIDHPTRQEKVGYGDVYEMTLAMPVPPGTASLSRCLRLREVGDRMTVETAADCLDSSFVKSSRMRLPPPPNP